MKKVIDSHGNELEIGKVYEFSNDKIDWYVAGFKKVSDCGSEYLSERFGWKLFIRECQSSLGTIKKAPVKMVDDKAYQFESNGSVCIGIFDGENLQDNNRIYMLRGCTNIIPLVPETK